MIDYSARVLHKPTGQWITVQGVRKFGRMYYSFDGFKTQSTSKVQAYKLATGSKS